MVLPTLVECQQEISVSAGGGGGGRKNRTKNMHKIKGVSTLFSVYTGEVGHNSVSPERQKCAIGSSKGHLARTVWRTARHCK